MILPTHQVYFLRETVISHILCAKTIISVKKIWAYQLAKLPTSNRLPNDPVVEPHLVVYVFAHVRFYVCVSVSGPVCVGATSRSRTWSWSWVRHWVLDWDGVRTDPGETPHSEVENEPASGERALTARRRVSTPRRCSAP